MHWTLEELIGAFRCNFLPVQVLVVDDDLTARAAARRALEQQGYSVIVAEQAEDALKLLERSHTPVDLLVTAVSMPGSSGVDLARALRQRVASIPVIFLAADGAARARCAAIGRPVWVVEKPFLPQELIGAVQHALGAPGPSPPADSVPAHP